jgi:c-di-GMP-binding flagellar brake protein YcgR
MQERRRFVRFQTRLPVTYAVEPQSKPIRTVSRDIGGGGICFFAESAVAPGTRLQVTLHLPERDQLVSFTAEVMCSEQYDLQMKGQRHRSAAIDVRFIEIAPHDQADVMHHVMRSLQAPAV